MFWGYRTDTSSHQPQDKKTPTNITFYYGSGSTYAWRVWLALEHKQLTYNIKHLSFAKGDTHQAWFVKLNPREKVPVITDNGFVIHEPHAIIEYLDEQYPQSGKSLMLGQVKARAYVRQFIEEVDRYFVESMRHITGEILFKSKEEWDEKNIATGIEQVRSELAYFEEHMQGEYFVNKLSAADFTLYPMIALLFRMEEKYKPDLGIKKMLGPKLLAWKQRIEHLPYFQKTIPPHWITEE